MTDQSSSRIGAKALPTKRCSLAKRGTVTFVAAYILGPIFVLHQLPQFKLCSLKNSCVTIEIIIIITIASRFNNDKLADV